MAGSYLDDLLSQNKQSFDCDNNDAPMLDSDIEQGAQGSDQWFRDRIKKVNASRLSDLMSCSSRKGTWSEPEKVVDFGKGFLKVVYGMIAESLYDTPFISAEIKQFKYGKLIEPLIVDHVLKKIGTGWIFKECKSIDFIEGVASCSPDGKFTKGEKVVAFEAKAAMSLDNVYVRQYAEYCASHKDFWQTQAEMITLKCNKLIYATALPQKDMNVFWRKVDEGVEIDVVDVLYRELQKDDICCNAILERCRIAGLVRDWCVKDGSFEIEKALTQVL